MGLNLLPADDCDFDCVSLGEVMLRLDPGEGRIRTARTFRLWEGGGEYNVVRGLRRCFAQRTALVSALADNEIGRLIEDLILQGGVDAQFVQWRSYDGVGRTVRNGLNFTERGFGIRAALGVSDRGQTAASQLSIGDVDWDALFRSRRVRWFHTGGIFAALSEATASLVCEACAKARENNVVVSYDLNYRPSLWKHVGGLVKAREVNQRIAPLVDVIIGNEEDFTACLGLKVEGVSSSFTGLDVRSFRKMIDGAVHIYPNFRVVATTLREVTTASRNDWSAICWHAGEFYPATQRRGLEIWDRVGGGDSFASGLIYGFLKFNDPRRAVEYGAAHGALAMTTPGDNSMASLAEVEALIADGSARAER